MACIFQIPNAVGGEFFIKYSNYSTITRLVKINYSPQFESHLIAFMKSLLL